MAYQSLSHLLNPYADEELGPTTDYGTSVVQWIRHRRRGRARTEQERPSASYMIDVSTASIPLALQLADLLPR